MAKFEINILGCGSALMTERHVPTCQVLNIRENLFMIDCGEGAQLQMRRMGLKPTRLKHIFISHMHGDHYLGLPGLLSTMSLMGCEGTVTIHVLEEGARFLKELMDYVCPYRSYDLQFNIITGNEGVIYEDDAITVTSLPLYHQRVPAVGFIFAEKPKPRHIDGAKVKQLNVPYTAMKDIRNGLDYVAPDGTVIPNEQLTTPADPSRSYAFCSDTMYDTRVAEAVKGVDWLYHEATFDASEAEHAMVHGHSTAAQTAQIAQLAEAKNLIIGHFSQQYDDDNVLLRDAAAIFPNTHLADEGKKFVL